MTLMAAAGAVVPFFPTGQGGMIGSPIDPVISITADPKTAGAMSELIDGGCQRAADTDVPAGGGAKATLPDHLARAVNGLLTAAEALGHREFVRTKLYPGA